MIRGRALAVIGCALVLALAATGFAGCGDDDPAETTTPTTEPVTPTGAAGPGATDAEDEAKEEATGGGDVGLEDGTVSPPPETDPENLPTEPGVDSPENDIPPEPGSPAEKFENFCDENPDACS